MKKRVHVLVGGKVQGVCFRVSAREQAIKLAVQGFVRNLPDGRVEIIAQGMQTSVDRFVEWCEEGPEHARVDDLQVEKQVVGEEFQGFWIVG
ncbi:MAG: acylphosphatase [Pseudomonadota bacterium]|jgi:acylphosphatase|nr:acylphosphatase [Pseudomonadota bacterium]